MSNIRQARINAEDAISELEKQSRKFLTAVDIGVRLTTPEPSDIRDTVRQLRKVEERLQEALGDARL